MQSTIPKWARRFAWAGTLSIATIWLTSLFIEGYFRWYDAKNGDHSLSLKDGQIELFSVYGMCRGDGSCEREPWWEHLSISRVVTRESVGLILPVMKERFFGASPNQVPRFEKSIIPLWLPLVLFAAPALVGWWRRCRHMPPGLCRRCRYDLRENASGRCPECGTPIVIRGTREARTA